MIVLGGKRDADGVELFELFRFVIGFRLRLLEAELILEIVGRVAESAEELRFARALGQYVEEDVLVLAPMAPPRAETAMTGANVPPGRRANVSTERRRSRSRASSTRSTPAEEGRNSLPLSGEMSNLWWTSGYRASESQPSLFVHTQTGRMLPVRPLCSFQRGELNYATGSERSGSSRAPLSKSASTRRVGPRLLTR